MSTTVAAVSTEKRPFKISDEAMRQCAAEMFDRLTKCCDMKDFQRDDAIRDLVKHGRPYMDGYQLAKTLDDSAHWDCDLTMAEELDAFSALLDRALERAEREWAERCKIEPPLPVGTAVVARWGGQDITVTIDSIYKHGVAKYCVKRDGELGTSCMIVSFENVRSRESSND